MGGGEGLEGGRKAKGSQNPESLGWKQGLRSEHSWAGRACLWRACVVSQGALADSVESTRCESGSTG